ncbi:MAG: site-specific integrase [Candidatus Bathyarchaeia archaeon]
MAESKQFKEITLTHSSRGRKLSRPITFRIIIARSPGEKAVQDYVIESLSIKMPSLIPFVFENSTVVNRAKDLKFHYIGSPATLYQDVYGVYRFSKWIGQSPDELFKGCLNRKGKPDPSRLDELKRRLDDFMCDLKAGNTAPSTVANYVKGVKGLFKSNGVPLELPFRISRKKAEPDHSPTPEELQQVLDIAAPRERAIVSFLALTGVREGTLVRLKYRHVQQDLEARVSPIHIHVEVDITKGEYGAFDTFLAGEGVEYLKAYLQSRRAGTEKIPSEEIMPDSPLFSWASCGRPLTESRIHALVSRLYLRAGIISKADKGRRYRVRPHSLRKYFRTQLAALSIPTDHVEYMMGHVMSTYNDVQSLGIEKLRNEYATAGLSIRPRTRASKIEMVKSMLESIGVSPEEMRAALVKPNRTVIGLEDGEAVQLKALQGVMKRALLKELGINSWLESGSPAEIRTPV